MTIHNQTLADLEKKVDDRCADLIVRMEQMHLSMEEICTFIHNQAARHRPDGSSINNRSGNHSGLRVDGYNSYSTRISKLEFLRFDDKQLKEWLYKYTQLFRQTVERMVVQIHSILLPGRHA